MRIRLSGDFAKGFGCGCTAVSILGGGFGLGAALFMAYFMSGPALAVTSSAPDIARLEEPFTLALEVHNPHDAPVEVDNIDVPQRVLDHFDIEAGQPMLGEPVGGFGSLTWFPEKRIAPASRLIFELEVVPLSPGQHVLEVSVCNDSEDCSRIVQPIEVLPSAAPGILAERPIDQPVSGSR